MSAEKLRQAATLLRERAEAATPGPWRSEPKTRRADVRGLPEKTSYDYRGDAVATAAAGEFGACRSEDAAFIATMDPTVALALADWLDHEVEVGNLLAGHDRHFGTESFPGAVNAYALAVADAVLAEASR